jgi:hypothetical protein
MEKYVISTVNSIIADYWITSDIIESLGKLIKTPGDLNYVLSSVMWRVFDNKPSYTFGNSLIGQLLRGFHKASLTEPFADWIARLLENIDNELKIDTDGVWRCVELEFYRRKLAIYENEAIARNGDINI